MVAIPLDKINYNKVSKYANVLIFKEFYPKTKNVSYCLKRRIQRHFSYIFDGTYMCMPTEEEEGPTVVLLSHRHFFNMSVRPSTSSKYYIISKEYK